jgi:hypothetical protein
MIKIELTEDTKAIVIGKDEEQETISLCKGAIFEDVVEFVDGSISEWQYTDEDMVSTFIPQNKCVVLS